MLGNIADIPFLKTITEADLNSRKFKNLSRNENGLTLFGFK